MIFPASSFAVSFAASFSGSFVSSAGVFVSVPLTVSSSAFGSFSVVSPVSFWSFPVLFSVSSEVFSSADGVAAGVSVSSFSSSFGSSAGVSVTLSAAFSAGVVSGSAVSVVSVVSVVSSFCGASCTAVLLSVCAAFSCVSANTLAAGLIIIEADSSNARNLLEFPFMFSPSFVILRLCAKVIRKRLFVSYESRFVRLAARENAFSDTLRSRLTFSGNGAVPVPVNDVSSAGIFSNSF